MNYVYQEPVITTITDEDITDEKAIHDLLKTIQDNGHFIQMTFEDEETYHIRKLDNVRITRVTESVIDIHSFLNGASIRYKDIAHHLIRSIRLIATKQILNAKYKVTRFHHMDVAEIET